MKNTVTNNAKNILLIDKMRVWRKKVSSYPLKNKLSENFSGNIKIGGNQRVLLERCDKIALIYETFHSFFWFLSCAKLLFCLCNKDFVVLLMICVFNFSEVSSNRLVRGGQMH